MNGKRPERPAASLIKLTEKLEKLCGHGVVAEYETDKNVIGGLVVRMDDILIDGSVETKLKQIKEVIEK